ncbi:MAG: glutamine synthetase beta-grasp domain-containing protein, partial [Blautia sp.]|nr:glutamine synthetase beta-grasp domain-containing protein [Blautia sp.]
MGKTLQDIRKMMEENDINMVDFKLVDIDGRWRHLSIPAERLNESTMTYGIGFDGSNYGYAPVENSDMVFIPVLDSAVPDRYAKVPTLSMIGDVRVIDLPDNRPFDQYPRNVAIRALEYMKETGTADRMIIGPEYEFYIFDSVRYKTDYYDMSVRIDTSQAAYASGSGENNNGYQVLPGAGYHNALPTDIRNDLRSRMCLSMKDWGVQVKYHHPEVGGSGQMEIEVELGDMLKLADDTMSAKYVIKNEAVEAGATATFMPKPLASEAGSGMHVHMLLLKDGKPVFYDPDGYAQLSRTAHYFMGGLLTHVRS